VIDARRGEVFAAAYAPAATDGVHELTAPRALAPADLAGLLEQARAAAGEDGPLPAVGDGALLYRGELEDAGAVVPEGEPLLHRVSAKAVCAAGARTGAGTLEDVVPDYLRPPDAEIALDRSAGHAPAGR
jgi:tRNA threonylcarbamoyladenosine biosynthesis protein TsaB